MGASEGLIEGKKREIEGNANKERAGFRIGGEPLGKLQRPAGREKRARV